MTTARPTSTRHARTVLWALCTALAGGSAFAAHANAEDTARYQREMAVCNSGQSNQTRAACIDEAKSAYAEARRGVLGDGMTVDPANAAKRCAALRGSENVACKARMKGLGSQSGSVAGGGVYRELVTTEPAPAPKDAPVPAPN